MRRTIWQVCLLKEENESEIGKKRGFNQKIYMGAIVQRCYQIMHGEEKICRDVVSQKEKNGKTEKMLKKSPLMNCTILVHHISVIPRYIRAISYTHYTPTSSVSFKTFKNVQKNTLNHLSHAHMFYPLITDIPNNLYTIAQTLKNNTNDI